MRKRKLRACSNCGGRHGPPTGKSCTRSEEVFREKNEEMGAIAESGVEGAFGPGETAAEESHDGLDSHELNEWVLPDFPGPMSRSADCGPKFDFTGRFAKTSAATTKKSQGPAQTQQPDFRGAQASANMADESSAYELPRRVGLSENERIMSDRMMRLENTMGDLASAQKTQIDRLVDLFKASLEKKKQEKPSEEPAAAGAASAKDDSDMSVAGSEEDEWKEFFGAEVWRKEKDRIRKNPFDHRSYGKMGKEVETFEQLMVIQFKTITQLLDLKYDVRGLVKHGLMMSEKAAKDVYEAEAFVQYDDSVRTRAGAVGPTAFGSVDQEDVLRFFPCDNMKKKKQPQTQAKVSQTKKNKFCLRYNDSVCTSKNCQYAHRCIACEEWGHPKKDCKNVNIKRKDAK